MPKTRILPADLKLSSSLNALSDVGEKTSYHLALGADDNTDDLGVGIAFSRSANQSNVGSAIIFKRTDSNSQGELQFYTKQSTSAGADPTKAMTLDDNGNLGIGGSASLTNTRLQLERADASASPCLAIQNTSTGDSQINFWVGDITRAWSLGIDNDDADSFKLGTFSGNYSVVTDNTALEVQTSGEINKPLQPAFNVALTSNSSTSFIPDGSWATVQFTGEVFDVGANFSSYTFTAPVTGKYLLTTSVRVNSISHTATYYWLRIDTSNRNYYGTLLDSNDLDNGGTIEFHTFNLTVIADMDANDTATVDLSRNGGSATAVVQGNSSTSTVYTMFHGQLIS